MSVIEYVVSNVKASEEILKVEEGYRTESDHIPLEVTIEGVEMEQKERSDTIEKEKHVWTEEGIEYYHGNCKGWVCTQDGGEIGTVWKETN